MKIFLRFDCGARLPEEGYLNVPYSVSAKEHGKKPRKDGRYRIAVAGTIVSPGGRPILPDGKRAGCGDCPCKKSSGRKSEMSFPSGHIITCYPSEVEE